jgi:hypothetical protein
VGILPRRAEEVPDIDWLLIALRVVHIGTAVFWAGSAFFFFGFIEPTTVALGPESQKFMHHIVDKQKITQRIIAASTFTVAAGALLFWRDSSGFDLAWITRPTGLIFTLGGLAGLAAWLNGLFGIGPSVHKLDQLGTAIVGAGRPPSAEELGRMGALSARLHVLGIADVALLGFALLAMATARYVSF